MYEAGSPIRLHNATFPGSERPERSVIATNRIPAERFIFPLSGITSSGGVPDDVETFSIVRRKSGRAAYDALLVGPIRFVNHHCDPNAEVRILFEGSLCTVLMTK